ncbi:MAG: hypothetical protein ABW086_08795 [Sedimenticola sp.]
MQRPPFRVIQGGKTRMFPLGSCQVTASPRSQAPFPVDATVFEEDTWRVLSADKDARPEKGHPVRLMTDMVFDQQVEPGSLLIRGKRWLAVIHDLEMDPTCREAWIRKALAAVLEAAGEQNCRALALPLLGSVHGCIAWQESLQLITDALLGRKTTEPALRIWLQISPQHLAGAVTQLNRTFSGAH